MLRKQPQRGNLSGNAFGMKYSALPTRIAARFCVKISGVTSNSYLEFV